MLSQSDLSPSDLPQKGLPHSDLPQLDLPLNEVKTLRAEGRDLKEALAEQTLETTMVKKLPIQTFVVTGTLEGYSRSILTISGSMGSIP